MKKFVFTLESLKKYNNQILDSEKSVLGRLRAELSELKEQEQQKLMQIDEERDKLAQLLQNGTDAMRLSVHKKYISSLQQEIYKLQAQQVQKSIEIEKQLDKVVDATKEVSKVEKLEEKQLEEYKYQAQKESEQFIEEFVSNAAAREGR